MKFKNEIMNKIFLFVLLTVSMLHSQKLLVLGNSRASTLVDFPSEEVADLLDCIGYYTGGIPSSRIQEELDSLEAFIAHAGGEESIRAVLFMDLANNLTYIYNEYSEIYNDFDSLIRRCLEFVQPDSFYIVQTSPGVSAISDDDSAVVTSQFARGSRGKNLFTYSIEWDLALKYGLRIVPCYDYFSNDLLDSADYPNDDLYLGDQMHHSEEGQSAFLDAIPYAQTITSKHITWGNGYFGTWRNWTLTGSTSIPGDTVIGTVSVPDGDSILSPVKCGGQYTKYYNVTPYLASGSVNLFIRHSDSYFLRNDTMSWKSITDEDTTVKNYYQIMMVATSETVVDSIKVFWSNTPITENGYKCFGNRKYMVRFWNKDATVFQGYTRAWGEDTYFSAKSDSTGYMSVLRWGFDYDIPEKSIIDSAKMHLFNYLVRVQAVTGRISPLLVENGRSRYWDEWDDNGTSDPDAGQATYYRARAGYEDSMWTSDSITTLDHSATLDPTFIKEASAPVGTEVIVDVKNITQLSINDTGKYYGWLYDAIESSGTAQQFAVYSQNHGYSHRRPYLEVWYKKGPVPIIDSIISHVKRDYSKLNCARIADTVTIIFTEEGDIGDSNTYSAVYLGRDTTGLMEITGWFNKSGKDSLWCVVPIPGVLNVNYRPILVSGYGAYSEVRTPVTWREQWILNVKGFVR